MASQGIYGCVEAYQNENPFPAVCGAICNRRCEDACTRGTIDEPIAIDEIKSSSQQKRLMKKTDIFLRL